MTTGVSAPVGTELLAKTIDSFQIISVVDSQQNRLHPERPTFK